MDLGHTFQCFKNPVDRIPHGDDEARGELTQSRSGIHQGGRIGHKFQIAHELVEFFLDLFGGVGRPEILFGSGNMGSDPAEKAAGSLDDILLIIS